MAQADNLRHQSGSVLIDFKLGHYRQSRP